MPLRIGIDLGGTKIEGIVLDGSREAARLRVDTPRGDYAATLGAMAALVNALERQTETGATIGIGIPGTISPATGLVKNANSAWLIGQPLQTDLEQLVARPVRIANDANCFATSEATDGAGEGAEVVFGVIIGTGVGGGIAVNGRSICGPNGIAGEWGHNPLPWPDGEDDGRLCYCGKQACIETFLSGPGFAADHEAVAGVRLHPAQIVEAADRGDAAAEQTLRRYERRMARALASIINVLDPDVIVLGGGMSNTAPLYRNVPKLWDEFIFSCGASRSGSAPHRTEIARTTLVRARHGATSGVRGAAWLWPDTIDVRGPEGTRR